MQRQIALLIIVAATMAACGGPVPTPVVDMTGVDQATYNHDLAECVNDQPAIAIGNPVTSCMKAKGYKILVGY